MEKTMENEMETVVTEGTFMVVSINEGNASYYYVMLLPLFLSFLVYDYSAATFLAIMPRSTLIALMVQGLEFRAI